MMVIVKTNMVPL